MGQIGLSIRKSQHEKFMVGFLVFVTFWYLLTGLQFWMYGVVSSFLGGKMGYLLFSVMVLLLFLTFTTSPGSFQKKNIPYAILYLVSLLVIYFLTWAHANVIDNDLIIWGVNGFVFIALHDELKLRCFDKYVRILSVLLCIALFEYIVYVVSGVSIVTATNIQRGYYQQSFDQLLFNFLGTYSDTPRFQFLTEEPGLLGTACGFLIFPLYGNQRYRFAYIIFVISGILSFSLAFYLLFIIHLLASGLRFRRLLLFFIGGFLLYYIFKDYFNTMIIERVMDQSLEQIDDRSTEVLKIAVYNAWKSNQLWLGHGNMIGVEGGNAGVKIWLWIYGIIGVSIIVLVYSIIYWRMVKDSKAVLKSALVFFVAFWISFYQRHTVTFMDYIIVYFTVPLLYSNYFSYYSKLMVGSKKTKVVATSK